MGKQTVGVVLVGIDSNQAGALVDTSRSCGAWRPGGQLKRL